MAIGESSLFGKMGSPANLSGYAAYQATGLNQAALEALSATFDVPAIPPAMYQARADMVVTGGPYAAGVDVVAVATPTRYSAGQYVAIPCTDSTIFRTSIASIAGSNLTLSANIPAGKTIDAGALVYVAGDLTAAFNEAFEGTATNINVITP